MQPCALRADRAPRDDEHRLTCNHHFNFVPLMSQSHFDKPQPRHRVKFSVACLVLRALAFQGNVPRSMQSHCEM